MKTKKISWQAIAIVVLALVLIASIALGVSGAWFQDRDSVTTSATMDDPVVINLSNGGEEIQTFGTTYKTNVYALPGDKIMDKVQFSLEYDTPTIVRVSITATIKDADGTTLITSTSTPGTKPAWYKGEQSEYETEWTQNRDDLLGIMNTAKVDVADGWIATLTDGNEATDKTAKYYYYGSVIGNAVQADDAKNTSETYYDIFESLTIPESITNVAQSWVIDVSVKVEALQAANVLKDESAATGSADYGVLKGSAWFGSDLPDDLTAKVVALGRTNA